MTEPSSESNVRDLLAEARPVMTGILARFQIPREDAEDLLQETFLHYLKKRPEIREPKKWLSGALRNQCRMYWRQRDRRLYESVDAAVLDLVCDETMAYQDRSVLLSRVGELIGSLKSRCRSILELRYRLGYDDQEIAERTDYQPASVDKIARRCLHALSRRLTRPRHG